MKIQVEDLARQQLLEIYYYNSQYSLNNAFEINSNIRLWIHNLEDSPYIGRYIPEVKDKRFREIIYKKTRHSAYRIIYYISKKSSTIYILSIINNRQDFKSILKLHNYFNNYFNF